MPQHPSPHPSPGPARLESIIRSFAKKKVLVVGDVMLDVYIDVTPVPGGFNPESDAPNLMMGTETYSPGGAANVATNLFTLGAYAFLLGMTGNMAGIDVASRKLESLLIDKFKHESLLGGFHFCKDPSRPTTTKTRLVEQFPDGTHEHWGRLNKEKTHQASPVIEGTLIAQLDILSRMSFDGIYLSDYDKGIFSPVFTRRLLNYASDKSIPVFVDPKPANISEFKGATYMKVNKKEADELKKLQELRNGQNSNGQKTDTSWNDAYGVQTFIQTNGAHGAIVLSNMHGQRERVMLPSYARKVGDVVGAGDTFGAAFFLASLCGANREEAGTIAAYAAAVGVEKKQTSTASSSEILLFMKEYLLKENTS